MEIVDKRHVGTRQNPRVQLSLKCGCRIIVDRRSPDDENEHRCPAGCDPKRSHSTSRVKRREAAVKLNQFSF
jgi:hypothetical protein